MVYVSLLKALFDFSEGMDMANAFLEYLLGKEVTKVIRGVIELSAKEEDEDEFAAYYNLV